MNKDLVQAPASHGLDVLATTAAGLTGYSDEQQLLYATAQGRVLYSYNVRDSYALHTAWLNLGQEHAGIILAQTRYSVGEQVRRLVKLISSRSSDDMKNQVEFLSAWS